MTPERASLRRDVATRATTPASPAPEPTDSASAPGVAARLVPRVPAPSGSGYVTDGAPGLPRAAVQQVLRSGPGEPAGDGGPAGLTRLLHSSAAPALAAGPRLEHVGPAPAAPTAPVPGAVTGVEPGVREVEAGEGVAFEGRPVAPTGPAGQAPPVTSVTPPGPEGPAEPVPADVVRQEALLDAPPPSLLAPTAPPGAPPEERRAPGVPAAGARTAEAEAGAEEVVAAEPEEAAAPEPVAPEVGEVGDIDAAVAAWSGRLRRTVQALPPAQLPPGTAYAEPLRTAGAAAAARWERRTAEIPKEAKRVLEAKPLEPLAEIPAMPVPDPVPHVTEKLRGLAKRELPDQRLPALRTSPGGFLPTVGAPPVDTNAPPAPLPPAPSGPVPKSTTPVPAVNRALAEPVPPAPVPGAGAVVTGSERPAVHAIAAPHRGDVAKVLARVYLDAEGFGSRVLKDARATAYTGLDLAGEPALARLGEDLAPAETEWFRSEIRRVADAAQIGKQALDDAIAARTKELGDQRQAGASEVAKTSQEQTAELTRKADTVRSSIQSLREAWDSHWDRVAAEAKGGVDPKAVRAEQERLAGQLRTFTEQHVTAWSGVQKVRDLKLDRAGEDQVAAYTAAALADQSQRVQASVTEVTDDDLKTWLRDRHREVRHAVGVLKEDVQKVVDGWKAELRVARDEGIEEIRAWADKRIGRERGWLDRLIARLFEAIATKHEETAALAQAQTEETVTALGQDLQLVNDLKTKGYEALDRDGKEHLRKQDAEQQAVLKAFFEGPAKGDTITYLAQTLQIRLRRQRTPAAITALRQKVLALDNVEHWEALEVIGKAQNPAFSAQTIADNLWAAFEHIWGTDEDKAYAAVQGLTAEQGKAVRGAYQAFHHEDLDARVRSEMSGSEYQRVRYGLEGQQARADAAAIRDAVQGAGTDEELINKTLRNKTPAERIAIEEAYKSLYGEDMRQRLREELSGDDRAITEAHLEGNTARADAIEVKAARESFWGPDTDKMEKVYTRVRDEATQFGDARGWTTAEIGAEIARRTGRMQVEYKDHTKRDMLGDLEQALTPPTHLIADPRQRESVDQYWKGRRDLVLGLATGDLVRADAGKIQIERTGFYAKDETIAKVLALQYDRAYDNEKRDALVRFAEEHHGRQPTKEEMKTLEAEVIERAERTGQANMAALGLHVETHYTYGRESFKDTIKDLTQGVGEEKAVALVDQGGRLKDWQVLEFATKGAGTDDEAFKKLMKRTKTKDDMNALEGEWQKNTGRTETIKDLIEEETSGRLRNDLLLDYKHGGEPEDPRVVVAKAKDQLDFERRAGGVTGYRYDPRTGVQEVKSHEFEVMERRLARLEQEAARYEAALKLPEGDPAKAWALHRWKAGVEGFASARETHRFLLDQRTEVAAQVVAMAVTIAVAVVLTVATMGAGAAPSVALIGGVSAAFGAAAGIATKASMKGAAYGADELTVDIAVGLVDTIVSAATAGVGGKILKSAAAAAKAGGAGARGALVALGRLAEGSAAQRATAHFIAEGAEGLLQSLPTSVLATAANKQTWTEGNPFLNMLLGVGMGVGMGTLASGTIGGLTNLRKVAPGAPDVAVPSAPPPPGSRTGLLDARASAVDVARLEARYFELHPTRTKADFRRDFDELLLLQAQHNPDVAAKLSAQLRDEITDLLTPHQKAQLGDHAVEMWDAKRFEEFTGSRTGQAVVIVKDGRPTVVVKQGADPHELAQEGFHLLQAVDPRTKAKVARLDEAKMRDWRTLDVRERFQLYKEKLDLELDAQRQMVSALEARARAGEDVTGRLAAARDTLANLEKRFVEVSRIGPFQRTLMAWGVLPQPPWLDQPARLFAKRKPQTSEVAVIAQAKAAAATPSAKLPDADVRLAQLLGHLNAADAQQVARSFKALYDALAVNPELHIGWIESIIKAAGGVLDPKVTKVPPGMGRGLRAKLVRIGLSFVEPGKVTRTVMEEANRIALSIKEVLDHLRPGGGVKRGPEFASSVLTQVVTNPTETPVRLMRAAARVSASSALDDASLRQVAAALDKISGPDAMTRARDLVELVAELASHSGNVNVVGTSSVKAIIAKVMADADPVASLRTHIETLAGLPAGATALGGVPPFGYLRVLAESGPAGVQLVHRVAQMQAAGSIEGLGAWAQFVFVKSNKTGVDLQRTVNEMHAAMFFAGEVTSLGGRVRIDTDALAKGSKSFDLEIKTLGPPPVTVKADVMTPDKVASQISGFTDPMRHSLEKARHAYGKPIVLPPDVKLSAVGVVTFGGTYHPKGGVPQAVKPDGTYGLTGDLLADLAARMTKNQHDWLPLHRYVLLDTNGNRIGEIRWDGIAYKAFR